MGIFLLMLRENRLALQKQILLKLWHLIITQAAED